MLHELEPIIKKFGAHPGITLLPVFDLHIGSEHFNQSAWESFVSKVAKAENTYLLIGGDCIDNGLSSSVTLPYEQTMRPREQKIYLAETLQPIADKILCGVSGNHEYRSVKAADDNPLFDVFCKLNMEDRYRENGAFLFLTFGNRDMPGRSRPYYCIMVHHGSGGGMYIGSQTYKQERFASAVEGLDILVTGHTHKPITFPGAKLVCNPQNSQVMIKEFRVVTANSWLGYGGYAMRKMMAPVANTMTEIYLNGTKKEIRITQ